jgi:hypothetical protein
MPVAMTTAFAAISVPSSVVNTNEPSLTEDVSTFWLMNSAPNDSACDMPSARMVSPSLTLPK